MRTEYRQFCDVCDHDLILDRRPKRGPAYHWHRFGRCDQPVRFEVRTVSPWEPFTPAARLNTGEPGAAVPGVANEGDA